MLKSSGDFLKDIHYNHSLTYAYDKDGKKYVLPPCGGLQLVVPYELKNDPAFAELDQLHAKRQEQRQWEKQIKNDTNYTSKKNEYY